MGPRLRGDDGGGAGTTVVERTMAVVERAMAVVERAMAVDR